MRCFICNYDIDGLLNTEAKWVVLEPRENELVYVCPACFLRRCEQCVECSQEVIGSFGVLCGRCPEEVNR